MKKTLVAAAFALTLAGGSAALLSPALANTAWLDSTSGTSARIITVAATATPQKTQTLVTPQPQAPQEYPKYHDSQTATYINPGAKAAPCHFTQAQVEGVMKQVEVCD
ncbi:hypothetical protein DWF00_22030 [Bosea caraganae]|uniref:Uncharacterized protein n=1 Tax=Bosea caraganae TaxID=2763117 RepID=A0A370L5Q2_9HYPH|nr:hypothetical protein [Bosea caraganae]RDJ23314.1 hypothetical protein DWF00_22030 [Bosea caraganae]RDJ24574.1 hypothetical protein DWE98_12865 [Bosea caraganae]